VKHLCTIFLLTIFLYQLVGVYPVAMWQQHELRRGAEKRRRAALPDAALVRITVGRTDAGALRWQEKHEFSYRGRLYDVVRQRATRDSTTYLCWHDQGEEKLLAALTKHVREYAYPTAGARKSAKKALDYLSKLTFLPPADSPALVFTPAASRLRYQPYAAPLQTLPAPAPFTPPWPGKRA
jgi:hypothetical protein